MAKRSNLQNINTPVVDGELDIAPTRVTPYNKLIGKKAIRSKIDANLIVNGAISGNRYVFPKAGTIVYVDERDIDSLVSKRLGGRSCCGADTNANFLFEIV